MPYPREKNPYHGDFAEATNLRVNGAEGAERGDHSSTPIPNESTCFTFCARAANINVNQVVPGR